MSHYAVYTPGSGSGNTSTLLVSNDGETYRAMASIPNRDEALMIARILNSQETNLTIPDTLKELMRRND